MVNKLKILMVYKHMKTPLTKIYVSHRGLKIISVNII